jgi:hypothetical protein
VAGERPSASGSDVPSDVPPEYAEVYRAAFERAYAEAQATWSPAASSLGTGRSDVVHGEVVEESADRHAPTEARQQWAFEPPGDEASDPPSPEWEFEPPLGDEAATREWSFEPPGGRDASSAAGSNDGADVDGGPRAAAAAEPSAPPDDGDPQEDSWVVPGFAGSQRSASAPRPYGDRTPPWVALAVLVSIAFVVLLIFLVLIF